MERGWSMETILVVEDEISIQENIVKKLEETWEVLAAGTVRAAQTFLKKREISLCVLDVNLPDGDGYAFCQQIRLISDIPVIFLTVKDDEASILHGLEIGGDDYITKPFSMEILKIRIQAQLRRYGVNRKTAGESLLKNVILTGDYLLDLNKMTFSCQTEEIPLTRTEFHLLKILIENRGCMITRERLLDCIWDIQGKYVDANTLSVHMSRLRKKMMRHNRKCPIETVHGIGYRWEK